MKDNTDLIYHLVDSLPGEGCDVTYTLFLLSEFHELSEFREEIINKRAEYETKDVNGEPVDEMKRKLKPWIIGLLNKASVKRGE